jgi:hypothetical protein
MTDQELLEYAGKAVGLVNPRYVENTSWGTGISHGEGDEAYVVWNPLLSDADAFRLAVELTLSVYPPDDSDPTAVVEDWRWDIHITEVDEDGDYPATTRRAIVRAAAEVGRDMTG